MGLRILLNGKALKRGVDYTMQGNTIKLLTVIKVGQPTRLKDLKDDAQFTLSKSGTVYTLQSLNQQTKYATYTSNKSNNTFTKRWEKIVYPA